MKKVDALLIGAGRSGTTTFYNLLKKHPQVNWSTTKEVPYFSMSKHFNQGENYFHSFFEDFDSAHVNVTSDTYLLSCSDCVLRIKNYNPDIKLIVMLRHPAQRAMSAWRYGINNGYISSSIKIKDLPGYEKEWLQKGDAVEVSNHCPLYGSKYHFLLKDWKKHFAHNQILLLKTDDFENDTEMAIKIQGFLGVEHVPWNEGDMVFNRASGAKSKWMQQILVNPNHPVRKKLGWLARPFRNLIVKSGIMDKLKNLNKKEPVDAIYDEDTIQFLGQYFREDMNNMEKEWGITFDK
jgi:Sulfotransferase domain